MHAADSPMTEYFVFCCREYKATSHGDVQVLTAQNRARLNADTPSVRTSLL